MADSSSALSSYKRLAELLEASKKRSLETNPYVGAAAAFQPYVPATGQHTLQTGLIAGLGGIAQGLLGAYGTKQVNEEFGDTTSRAYNYIKSADYEGMSVDPDPSIREMALTLAMADKERTQSLDTLRAEEGIKAQAKADAEWAVDPRNRYLANAGGTGGQGTPPPGTPAPGEVLPGPRIEGVGASYAAPNMQVGASYGQPTMGTKTDAKITRLVQEGWMPDKAREFVVQQDAAVTKTLEEQRIGARALKNIGDIVLASADNAGYTGPGSSVTKFGDTALSIAGISEADSRLQARSAIDSVASEAMRLGRVVGGGAVSDFETRLIMGAAPGSDKRPEQNKLLAQLYKARAQLAEEQANFREAYYDRNNTLNGAEDTWQQYIGNFALVAPDTQGKVVVNDLKQQRGDWRNMFGGGAIQPVAQPGVPQQAEPPPPAQNQTAPYTTAPQVQPAMGQQTPGPQGLQMSAQAEPALLGQAWQGAKDAPGALWDVTKAAGRFIRHPIDTVTNDVRGSLDTVGNVSSGTSGALAGAALGAMGGPAAPVTIPVGAALGALAGQFGYKKGKQLTGAEENTTLAQDIPELAYGAGQNLALAAMPGAVKAGVKGATAIPRAIGRAGESIARALEKETLGVTAKDVRNAGAKLETALTRLEDENFFKGTGSNTKKITDKIATTLEEAGKQKGALIDEASTIIDDKLGSGSYRLKPNWKYAEQYISKKANSLQKKSLARALRTYKEDWAETGGTLKDLDEFKQTIVKDSDFAASAADKATARLGRALYKGFKESTVENFEAAMKSVAPERTSDLAKALSKYEDYSQFKKTIANKVAGKEVTDAASQVLLTGGLIGGPVASLPFAARVASRVAPIATAKTVRAATAPARWVGRGGDALAEALGGVPREAVIGAAGGRGFTGTPVYATTEEEGTMVQRQEPNTPKPPQASQELVNAVIKTESAGKINAVSEKGAKGLMQLMDATGKEWHKKLGLEGEYDPFNYEQNVVIGTAYLNSLLGKYGRKDLALAAYNWGMGNLDRLLKKTKTRDFAVLKKQLPQETQKYVSRILKNTDEDGITELPAGGDA